MECPSIEKNKKMCNCTYPCSRHGKCCECLAYHRKNGELPACYFTPAQEKTYDRSVAYYCRVNGI
ncbi:hypothetical protein KKF84_22595 [Myxococcota bacterium]|nr:hypothetical protein [Myxococcota bacterium]